jgi:asparagine synthase (glutamine-hydrolysing)
VLDEKHVLKAASRDLVPENIRNRPKQPNRAPDALAFVGPERPAWTDELMSPAAIEAAGVFDAKAVAQLWGKACKRGDAAQFSNTDNMAIVGVLSTQLLHRDVVAKAPQPRPVTVTTDIDRLAGMAP